jgi:hypothetical protein
MELLNELLGVLSGTIEEWNTFISPDSDVDYFSDLVEFPSHSVEFRQPADAGRSLRSIKETFGRLRNHQRKLKSLTISMSRDFTVVGYNIISPCYFFLVAVSLILYLA